MPLLLDARIFKAPDQFVQFMTFQRCFVVATDHSLYYSNIRILPQPHILIL